MLLEWLPPPPAPTPPKPLARLGPARRPKQPKHRHQPQWRAESLRDHRPRRFMGETAPDGTRTIPGQGFCVRHGRDGRAVLSGGQPRTETDWSAREYQHAAAVRLLDRLMETQEKV
jgi:hypothetical protein